MNAYGLDECPFCGSEEIDLLVNCVECLECGANIIDDNASEEDLIAHWNRRANNE